MPDTKPELKRSERGYDGAYCFGDHPEDKRYTVYVKYLIGDNPSEYYFEEIDVNATSYAAARSVAEAALVRDYEDGGEIAEIREQHGWYM